MAKPVTIKLTAHRQLRMVEADGTYCVTGCGTRTDHAAYKMDIYGQMGTKSPKRIATLTGQICRECARKLKADYEN